MRYQRVRVARVRQQPGAARCRLAAFAPRSLAPFVQSVLKSRVNGKACSLSSRSQQPSAYPGWR